MMKRFDTLAHAVMITFALASLGNVSDFMRAAHTSHLVTWALGAALGAVLVVTAIMMTRIDRETERESFWTLVVVVIVCAGLSGTIQFWAYSAHLPTHQAAVFGFGLPIIGEAFLAYSVSRYLASERRQRIRMATDGTEEHIAGAVASALAAVDVTRVKGYVEERVEDLTRAIADDVVTGLMPESAKRLALHHDRPEIDTTPSKPKGFYQKDGWWYFQAPSHNGKRPAAVALKTKELDEAILVHANS